MSYWEEHTDTTTLTQVLEMGNMFKSIPNKDANFGFRNSVHWLRMEVLTKTTQISWLLEVGYSGFAEVDLYLLDSLGHKTFHQQGGDWRVMVSRPISYHNFVFNLPLRAQQRYTVYLRLRPIAGQVLAPTTIWDSKAFIDYAVLYQLFWGIYFGMLLIVFLYHSVLYLFNLKHSEYRGYLFLSIYLITYILFELTRGGCIGARYLWPKALWWLNYGFIISFFVMMLMFITFYCIILDIPKRMPVLFRILKWLGGLGIFALMLIVFDIWQISKNLASFIFGASTGLLLLIAAVRSWRKEKQWHSTGFYYMIAAFMLYTGGILMLLYRAGLVKGGHFFAMNSLNIGSMIEFIALSIGLSLRIRIQQKERVELIVTKEREILNAKRTEVKRMTGAIHDFFGSQIIHLQDQVHQLYNDYVDTLNSKRMDEVFKLFGEIIDGISLLAHYYIPFKLNERGLRAHLYDLTQRYNSTYTQAFEAHLKGTDEGLSEEVQEELYYVALEMLANVRKHSQAQTALLLTYDEGNFFCMQVKDDGVGMPAQTKVGRRGLENIRERMESIHGQFLINSEPDRGTALIVKVPFLI
ncbi:MAG: 7TM-DISM domain-containing protein [Runella sp.]